MLLPLLALLATPLLLMLLRQRQVPLLAAALAGCAWPLLLPLDQPLWRAAGATLAGLMLVKSAQLAAGYERPQGALDTLLFLVIPAVAQWQQPRVPDPRRACRSFTTGALQFGAALCLVAFLQLFAPTHPAQLLLVELYVYAGLAGVFNLAVSLLTLLLMAASGVLFVRGAAGIDPTDSWLRCCGY